MCIFLKERNEKQIKTYYKTSSYLEVKKAFHGRFPENNQPTNMAMWENVENTGVKEQAQTSIRRDPTGRKKSRPKKQSNLLDCM